MSRVVVKKKEKKQNLKTFTKGILRRATYQWKPRNQALVNARVERGRYKCSMCEELFRSTEVQIDHIEPVIDPRKGFTTWDDYIERLFCPVEKFQILCTVCHEQKTRIEDSLREHYKTEGEELPDLTKQNKDQARIADEES